MNEEINPMILAAVAMLKKVDTVLDIEIKSDKMYRSAPTEEYSMGRLGVDVVIDFEDLGDVKTFLAYGDVEDLIMYPKGMFFAVELINIIRRAVQDPDTLFQEPNPDYVFSILKEIDEDGSIRLPRHTGNTETKIDTLPGFDDLKDEL